MVRFMLIFALSAGFAFTASGENEHVKPKPSPAKLENFILLSSQTAGLRLFLPQQAAASPQKLVYWNKQLSAYSQQWQLKKETLRDEQLLEQLFYDVHRRFLKNYTTYTGLLSLFETGQYNCLSATAFYALILEKLGYRYEIIESVNHVVLLVKLAEQTIMFETTDPANGFVLAPEAIAQRLDAIKNKEQASFYYDLKLQIFRSISLRELAGLQFYNFAAWYYNQRNYASAASNLQKAQILYKSERLEKVAQLMVNH